MDYLEQARRVIRLEISELERLANRIGDSFREAVHLVLQAIQSGGKTIIVGVGKSGDIGHKIASTLNSTGCSAVVLHPQNALHGDLGLVRAGDVALVLCQSGETREILDLLPHLRRRGVKIVTLTGRMSSTAAQHADVVLDTSVEREACPLLLAPTSSSTVALVLGDALAMVLLEARGFRSEDFAELHPQGQLGRVLLTRVRDIMRTEERLPLAHQDLTVRQTLDHMTACRAGAAVILDDEDRLAGIFTHGDFVRAYQKEPGVGDQPVSDYMSGNPISIHGDRLAMEALQILEQHRIDDLVVVDDDDRPIGLLDTQDLSRLHLV
ncbi:MAG TPA: KpsF/GutQ family sugar-phosphate isomerase [Verrucomicrobiales bacterium]|nr:KpsF/GutQ family sugar-phosphate isomerase [Verrucomicrobiales bacterium]